MERLDYHSNKHRIKSGDLLVWSSDSDSKISNAFLKIVKWATRSEHAHVGIAWVIGKRVFVIEATIPSVRIFPLSRCKEFHMVPMGIKWKEEYENILLSTVGKSYSFSGSLRAYFRLPVLKDDKWQCAELVNHFYGALGINFRSAYTPKEIVEMALVYSKKDLVYFKV